MALKPWYKVVFPREDLREGRPLDASEFAVHLDHVRDGTAQDDYQKPERFFERTHMTASLRSLAGETVRRLSGIKVETSPVFNLATQFGGGKTHALTLLYHMARGGEKAKAWKGVESILEAAGVSTIPKARTAVFVGTEFDSLVGRGGKNGEPLRKTPWGEIAYQLAGDKGLKLVAQHEEQGIAPSTEVLRALLPKDKPTVILMDELINYVSRNRKSGLGTQLYNFVHALSEEVRSHDNVVLAVSVPASELEMSVEDQADHERFKKLLDRVGKALILSAEGETSEIIRRRLFEWNGLPDDAKKTIGEYSSWAVEHRTQLGDFPVDHARDLFTSTYPFHPTVLSLFERKWQALPRFQRTRGVLRILALWVSVAYQQGFKKAQGDPLIGLGSAPLEDPMFRTALFEQLGESRLEAAVTTDISGKKTANSDRLDKEAVETIKKARLHRKVATTIFFESNGGQARAEATIPEIRLAVGEPDIDIGNIETVLEALTEACYYLTVDKNRYKFGMTPNLIKRLADRRASIGSKAIDDKVRAEIMDVFKGGPTIDKRFFPEDSSNIEDKAALTLVVLSPEHAISEGKSTLTEVEKMLKEHGSSSRTFKSALVFVAADNPTTLRDAARTLLAWEDIDDEKGEMQLDDSQKRQLAELLKRAEKDLKEQVWRSYAHLLYLDRKYELHHEPLGLVNSSTDQCNTAMIIRRLKEKDEVSEALSPNQIVKNWPPTFDEWSTKAVRDACFASPLFPRLMSPELVKDSIRRGVENGMLALVGKSVEGYEPFYWKTSITVADVVIADDLYIIQRKTAEAYEQAKSKPIDKPTGAPEEIPTKPPEPGVPATQPPVQPDGKSAKPVVWKRLSWKGEVPAQKWMNFYMKVLTRFATSAGLKLTVNVDIEPPEGITQQKVEETKAALKELGLNESIDG